MRKTAFGWRITLLTGLLVTLVVFWGSEQTRNVQIVNIKQSKLYRTAWINNGGDTNINHSMAGDEHRQTVPGDQNISILIPTSYPAGGTEDDPYTAYGYCRERRHVVYVRIPKTGSSTVTFLIWRFGHERGLRLLLPRRGFDGTQDRLTVEKYFLPEPGHYCDLMANHVLYNYENFMNYFPGDLALISMLREPMSQLYSTIHYFKSIANSIPGDNKVSVYLSNPSKYEAEGRSLTHNPMMSYFGLSKANFWNEDQISAKIEELDQRFEVILILEQLDESLVLLKRKLCWSMKDIIYIMKNKNRKKPKENISLEDYDRLRNWSAADYTLYDHYTDQLRSDIKKHGEDFQEELATFRFIQAETTKFCRALRSNTTLAFPDNKFSPGFVITAKDCIVINAPGGWRLLAILRRMAEKHNFCNGKSELSLR